METAAFGGPLASNSGYNLLSAVSCLRKPNPNINLLVLIKTILFEINFRVCLQERYRSQQYLGRLFHGATR